MSLKDFLFPKLCLGCGFIGVYICPECQKKLKHIEKDICLYCQKSSPFGLTHPICEKKDGIDGFMAIFYYNDFLKKIIKTIKYRLATEVLEDFFKIVEPQKLEKIRFYKNLTVETQNFASLQLQPIPLHLKKEKERGFNQAKIITAFFQKFLPCPISDFLIRKKETKSQAQAETKRERYLNIKGAFAVNQNSRDAIDHVSTMILIDDVLTTGWTIREAARTLKQAGAKKVFVLTLAKG